MKKANTIYVRNLYTAGSSAYHSRFGDLDVQVSRVKGSQTFVAIVDGKNKGITQSDAIDTWMWIGEYLSCDVVQKG